VLFRDGFVEVSLYLLKAFPRAFWGWPVAIIFGKPANSSPILLFSWWLIPPRGQPLADAANRSEPGRADVKLGLSDWAPGF
jgi:hypothetical protein